ncbi:MAG: hypothetical protein U0169_00125 [Polyangiaceae bacterium]
MPFPLSACLLGLVYGMGHALEPDHLAAVTTLATERKSPRSAMMLGAAWGVGHTASLAVFGGVLVLLQKTLPGTFETFAELVVAGMLLFLGVRATRRALSLARGGRTHSHAHTFSSEHDHSGPIPHVHFLGARLALRPLAVGLVHGLAGTGALTALVLSRFPSPMSALVYIVLFGAGSTLGMALLTGALGLPLSRVARHPKLHDGLTLVTGVLTIAFAVGYGITNVSSLLP